LLPIPDVNCRIAGISVGIAVSIEVADGPCTVSVFFCVDVNTISTVLFEAEGTEAVEVIVSVVVGWTNHVRIDAPFIN
jgi:hypothetical protein